MPEMREEMEQEMEVMGAVPESSLTPISSKRPRDQDEIILSCATTQALDMSCVGGNASDQQDICAENLIDLQPEKRLKPEDSSQIEKDADNNEVFLKVAAITSRKAQSYMCEADQDSPFFCKVCSIKCTSQRDFTTHCAGRRHEKALTGEVNPCSAKSPRKWVPGSKAKTALLQTSDCEPMKQQAVVNDIVVNLDQVDTGLLSSCEGCTDVEALKAQAFEGPQSGVGEDVILKQQDLIPSTCMEHSGVQILKNGSINEVTDNDHDHGNFTETVTMNGIAKGVHSIEEKSLLDVARRKTGSDTIARALVAAYEACACPGLESLLKPGQVGQAAGDAVSQAAKSQTMTMHMDCFINLLNDVQMKAIEGLFLHIMQEGRLKGFFGESLLSEGMPVAIMPPTNIDQDLKCTICRVEYGSKSDLDSHVAGKKHLSLVARLHSRCQVCNVTCNSEKDYNIHMSGKKHASKLRLAQKRGKY